MVAHLTGKVQFLATIGDRETNLLSSGPWHLPAPDFYGYRPIIRPWLNKGLIIVRGSMVYTLYAFPYYICGPFGTTNYEAERPISDW